jgi:anthranilate synthase component II
MKILLLDNHDSFTFNLAELLRHHGKNTFKIVQSHRLDLNEAGEFDKILLSPGPGLPEEQTAMFDILARYGETKPILGICLGIQAIATYYGGELFNLPEVIHGQPGELSICPSGHYLFTGIPDGSAVGLYHSWAIREETLPGCLEVLARSEKGIIMAVSHRQFPVCGLQFHPESIMTPAGQTILSNWLDH